MVEDEARGGPQPDEHGLRQTRRRWWNVSKPSTFTLLALLTAFAALGIAGGLLLDGSPFGQFCAIALVPGLSIAIGVVANAAYSQKGIDEDLATQVQNAVYTTLHLKRSVQFVDARLELAHDHLVAGNSYSALLEVVRAKTATGLSIGTAQQSSRQWESISESGARAAQAIFGEDDGEMRPTIKQGNNPKTVVEGEDQDGDD